MKKLILVFILLAAVKAGYGQAYIVTYLKGNVYHNNKPVKLHDKLDGVAQITSNDKTAELALFSAQKGKFRLTFANSKPIANNHSSKKSEFYQLIVADYLLSYTSEKTLTTRGAFDLETFFNYSTNRRIENKVFLIEGQLLPAPGAGYQVFFCKVVGKDTICSQVKTKDQSLLIDHQLIKELYSGNQQDPGPILSLIKTGDTESDIYKEKYFDKPVSLTLISKKELKDIIGSFKQGLSTYYHGDKEKLVEDIEKQLAYYYGSYYKQGVDEVLLGYLK